MSGRKFSRRFTFEELTQESTPQKIIYAALQEMAANGLSGTTTKSISERADLSTGIIHHYFDTKDNLIYAAYAYLVSDLHQRTLDIFRSESDPRIRLQALISMSFTTVHIASEVRDVWLNFWADAIHNERVNRLLGIYYRRYYSNLAHVFKDLLHDTEESREAAQLLLANIHGIWFTYRFANLPNEREQAIELVEKQLDMLLATYGCGSRPAPVPERPKQAG